MNISVTFSRSRAIPEFSNFSVSLPIHRAPQPEAALSLKALEELCNPRSFRGIKANEVLKEAGFLGSIITNTLYSLNANIEASNCSLQPLRFGDIQLGFCASANLINKHAIGEVPEELNTNQGILDLFWKRMMRQIVQDYRTQRSSLSQSQAISLLDLTPEAGEAIFKIAEQMGLLIIDKAEMPYKIIPTKKLIESLNNKQTQPRTAPKSSTKPELNKIQFSIATNNFQQCQTAEKNPKPPKCVRLFPELHAAIKELFERNPNELFAVTPIWSSINRAGQVNAQSPKRVGEICQALALSGFLKEENGFYQLQPARTQSSGEDTAR